MRVALIGSVTSSQACLEGLLDAGARPVAVLGLAPGISAKVAGYVDLSRVAAAHALPYQPFRKVSDPEVSEFLRAQRPDLLFVIGLSQLVPDAVLGLAPLGGVGFHPTLLPEGRGRAPVAWTLLREATAAVNLFRLVDAPDAGDLLVQVPVPLEPRETAASLIARMDVVLRQVARQLWPSLSKGELRATPQDHARASHYPKRTPEDGIIDWGVTTHRLDRFVRAVGRPYAGAFTHTGTGAKVVIHAARPGDEGANAQPGTLVEATNVRLVIATLDGTLVVEEWTCDEPLSAGQRLTSAAGGTWDDPTTDSPTQRAKQVVS